MPKKPVNSYFEVGGFQSLGVKLRVKNFWRKRWHFLRFHWRSRFLCPWWRGHPKHLLPSRWQVCILTLLDVFFLVGQTKSNSVWSVLLVNFEPVDINLGCFKWRKKPHFCLQTVQVSPHSVTPGSVTPIPPQLSRWCFMFFFFRSVSWDVDFQVARWEKTWKNIWNFHEFSTWEQTLSQRCFSPNSVAHWGVLTVRVKAS